MSLKPQKIVFWGTYDKGKPRVRILLKGAKAMGLEVIECHAEVWEGVEDKSQISGFLKKTKLAIYLSVAYPLLIYRYLRLPRHDIVFVGYMGHFDVLALWFFAFLRGVPVYWDVFLSLYDTVVLERNIVSEKSIIAGLLYYLEWLASRAAGQIILDTRSHAEYFETLYHLPRNSVHHIFVGAELDKFRGQSTFPKKGEKFTVLFYGQFISLHGVDTIVHAANVVEESGDDMRWVLIGKGQEKPRIDALIERIGIKSIYRIPWVDYKQLIEYISAANICLGIFGHKGKATRVIPNKVYQILAAGKPLITGDTPAIRELLDNGPTIRLVTPANPEALAYAALDLRKTLSKIADVSTLSSTIPVIGPEQVGKQLVAVLKARKTSKRQ